ncbi:MAG TPA: hypothetical protein VHT04_17400 [Stellaceae bacterium]|jgi:hypothetical protein|nr:hypothetical protein [Stellaceae bacterium]
MKYYRSYFLNADGHIARATVLKCADDPDAERQCRAVFAATDGFVSAEIWDGARQVYRYPDGPSAPLAKNRSRHEGEASNRDSAAADALNAEVARERRTNLHADAIKAAHLREQLLEQEAASKISQ